MGNDELASVNARREYMGNVMVSVNQKSLSRVCTVVIENAWVVFAVGQYCERFVTTREFSI